MAIQRDYGDRKSRKNSRMKYLLHRKGIKWFKKILSDKYFKKEIKKIRKEPDKVLIDYLGWHKQNKTSYFCLLYTSPSPRDKRQSRMPSSA